MEGLQSRRLSEVSAASEIDSDAISAISQPSQTHSGIDSISIPTSPCFLDVPAMTKPGIGLNHLEDSPLLLDDDHNSGLIEAHPIVKAKNTPDPPRECDWLPLTLRLPYLSFLFTLTLFLGILVSVLTVYSAKNYGLGNDDDSSSVLFFGWRFSPTLVATIYALLVASMLNDVRRTEIFARLSGPGGAPAKDTLCFPARSWWNDPCDALSKTKRSWALFFASLLYMLVILVISPLSAGLLSPIEIQIPRSVDFSRAIVTEDLVWELDTQDTIVFCTISGAILNQSTSAWLLNDSVVLPFWPLTESSASFGSRFAADSYSQQWKVQTVAYNLELDCTEMTVTTPYNATYNYTYPSGYSSVNSSENYTFFVLHSQDDCVITLADYADPMRSSYPWIQSGGGWWSDSNNSYSNPVSSVSTRSSSLPREVLFIQDFGHCINQSSSTVVAFDVDEFSSSRMPLDTKILNITQLRALFLSSSWSKHFSVSSRAKLFGGPLMAIAASKESNNVPRTLLANSDLKQQASRTYQQFFGEMLLQALQSRLQTERVSGHVVLLEPRILISMGIGVTLASLLLVSACCIVVVARATRLNRRALNLVQDPGTIAAAASLIVSHPGSCLVFGQCDSLSQKALTKTLEQVVSRVTHGDLVIPDKGRSHFYRDKAKLGASAYHRKDPRPVVFRRWLGALLLLCLLALTVAISVLYRMSCTTGIHQSPFVFQLNLDIFNNSTTLAPFSIIPTLLAVVIKLWFGGIGDALKTFQPYVSMVKAPATVSSSVLNEYVNTPIALAAVKAFKNSHWILTFVSLGALATEVFTVGMSALWDREIQSSTHILNITRSLELRSIPRIFERYSMSGHGYTGDSARAAALSGIYASSLQSWLYGAVIELSQSGSTPSWSKDTCSFLPLDVEALHDAVSSFNANTSGVPRQTTNVSFQTTALRGRLQCEATDYAFNKSSWLTTISFKDGAINPSTRQSIWDAANSPPGLDYGYTLTIMGLAGWGTMTGYLVCCANETNGMPGEAAVGHWASPSLVEVMQPGGNMTAKWLVGRPLEKLYHPNTDIDQFIPPLWIWAEKPKFLMSNCAPIFEQADASVVVDTETDVVYDYQILQTPLNATMAWSDNYLDHSVSSDYSGSWETTYGDPLNTSSYTNMTASWGYVFWDALISSGKVSQLADNIEEIYPLEAEDLDDRNFNFRIRGLNADFMSYAMLSLANGSKEALLQPGTFTRLASQTFSIFFKHYVSENITSALGGNAYQPIGEKLPWNLGPILDSWGHRSPYQGAMGTENDTIELPRFVTATVHVPVEKLVMSPIAVFLCLCLLAFLVVVTIVMYTANHKYYKGIPRGVEMLASTLAFVHGSEKLLAWVPNAPQTKPWYRAIFSTASPAKEKQMMARMGPFTTSDGTQRWGIELVDPTAFEHGVDPGSEGEHIELRTRVRPIEDDNSDIGMHQGLLGNFEWEASRSTLAPSDLWEQRTEDMEGQSQGVDRSSA